MSLVITPSLITIQNSDNTTKFTSNDKLIFKIREKTGTINVSGTDAFVEYYPITSKQFVILNIRINSTNGNSLTPVLGKWIPANGSIIMNLYARAIDDPGWIDLSAPPLIPYVPPTQLAASDMDILSANIIGTYLYFRINKITYSEIFPQPSSDIIANISYRAKTYSYL